MGKNESFGTESGFMYGSEEWWASDPPLTEQLAYALETCEEHESLMGWGGDVRAICDVLRKNPAKVRALLTEGGEG